MFSHPDDDDPVLIIVHCKSLYCRQPLMISRLYPRPGTSGRHTLAASWRHLGWCGLAVVVACAGYIWILGTESNSLSSSRSLRQPSIWYFLPSDPAELSWEKREGGEGKLSSRASGHSEIDGAQPSSSSKSWMDPNNCLKSAQFLF